MRRKGIAVSLGVVVLGAIAWLAFLPTGVRIGSLRVVPPAPGECVGRIEARVVNRTWHAVEVGQLWVRRDDMDGLSQYFESRVFPLREGGAEFAMFATDSPMFGGASTLEPWSSCVRAVEMVRVCSGATAHVSMLGGIEVEWEAREAGNPGESVQLTMPPVDIDPAVWPLPTPMSREALDRALGEGHELSILVDWVPAKGWGGFALEIGPGGRAREGGQGSLPGRPEGSHHIRAAGTLTPEQQASLRAAVRAAPLATFRADPQYLRTDCGSPVRLLVTAGPVAFAAGSQVEDFRAAGLEPLLEHLRLLLRDLPEAGGGR